MAVLNYVSEKARPVFLCLVLLLFTAGYSVPTAAQPRNPMIVSMGTHSLTVPWHLDPVDSRFNPSLTVGTERTLRDGDRFRHFHTVNIGFFQHYWWMTGVFVDAELGTSFRFLRGFHADAKLGIGYLHYFWRRKTLELEDGKYVEARDWGKPSLMVPLSLVLGYRGNPDHPLPVAPFVSVKWAVQAPFTDETPAMTHFVLAAGVRIHLGRSTASGGR
jgi:hypothetical protein